MPIQQLVEMERKLEEHITANKEEAARSQKSIDAIVDALAKNTKKLNEVFELYQHLYGALIVLSWLERAAVWVAKMAAAAGIIWILWQFSVSEGMKAALSASSSIAKK